MEKRYTLPVAIALVVGTVIGSGVFFKAEAVLTKTINSTKIPRIAMCRIVKTLVDKLPSAAVEYESLNEGVRQRTFVP